MKRVFFPLILALSLVFIFLAQADCDWQEYRAPVPVLTQQLRQETNRIMGNDFAITIYSSELPFAEIAKFYQERLSRDGWESIAAGSFPEGLIFKREDEMLNIQRLPAENPQETVFSLSRGKVGPFTGEMPQAEEKEFQDLPVYPNAKSAPLSSLQSASGDLIGYTTADSPEEVLEFYRQQLPQYGWQIENEMPLTDYGMDGTGVCPGCEKLSPEISKKIQGSVLIIGALQARKAGKNCNIGATETLMQGSAEKETIISIKCNR